jgi:hypothetical protein
MVAPDQTARDQGWQEFFGAINHQGDFYDSSVAAIPFLIDAAEHPDTPQRTDILYYFRDRWLDAPEYGGDPVVTEPPGGVDIPTPMRSAGPFASVLRLFGKSAKGRDKDFDVASHRRMDLCAWQTARAIQLGQSTFVRLADDADREVAAAAAALLLQWPETRDVGKRALVRLVADETDSIEQARRILEFGVYSATGDVATLARPTSRLPCARLLDWYGHGWSIPDRFRNRLTLRFVPPLPACRTSSENCPGLVSIGAARGSCQPMLPIWFLNSLKARKRRCVGEQCRAW